MEVGFIGVGIMGNSMAKNVIKGGHTLFVYDKDPSAVSSIAKAGGIVAESPKWIARKTNVVITMLPGPKEVDEVVFNASGIREGVKEGLIYVDMSTSSPTLAEKIAEDLSGLGVTVIDCPVGGGQPEAIAGTLILMAGGDKTTIDRVQPLLLCMGNELIYCGGPGSGQAMKLINNMLGAMAFQINTEAITLGIKAGLKLETMLEVFSKTAASNAILSKVFPSKAFKGDVSPGFRIKLAQKDVGLAVDLAKHLNVPVEVGALVLQKFSTLIAAGRGDQDISAILDAQAKLLGLNIKLQD